MEYKKKKQNVTQEMLEMTSDENDEETFIIDNKYCDSEYYSSDSSSLNPPSKRSRITSKKVVNCSLMQQRPSTSKENNIEFIHVPQISIESNIYNKTSKSNKNSFYFESSSSEDNEDYAKTPVLPLPTKSITWSLVTGKNLKPFKFSDNIEISSSVYSNYHLKTPYDFYKLLVNDEIISLMVNETNRYIKQCKTKATIHYMHINEWYYTDNKEMEIFIGILMLMILTLLPSLKSYWDSELYRTKITSRMKRNRFETLMKVWHFNNNDLVSNDRLRKLSPLISLLENNFQSAINPGEKLYINESVIPFRRGFKTKYRYQFGLRCVNLCLSNGYTYKLSVYFGKDLVLKKNLPSNVIMTLMKGLLGEGRILFTKDNYTSVPLAHQLLNNNTHLVGPLNAKREGNPKNIIKCKLEKETSIALESNTGIIIQKWKNSWNSEVLVLNTKYTDDMVIDFDKNGRMMQQPKSVYEISKCTSALYSESFDKMLEQMEDYHVRLSRRMKWYRRLAVELLVQTALLNAYILHQEVTNNTMDITDFRKNVAYGLFSFNC